MEISAIALAGMNAAQTRMEHTATRLAHVSEPEDRIDLSTEVVALMESRNDFAVNAKVFKTADQMQQNVLDILSDSHWG
jgi:flagellar basal body rod protein FlgC